ncbi:MAG: DUF423 domain-containing protein [Cyclobacteriaceae bacterium]|jgi:uncharacterized membrane protein YgdD (TMEM256/DUF423 family)|nr:DUF423 domain-containing protein [Cyclobacteriaceae bacterium]
MNDRQALLTGALLGLLSVALGAFGAHALKPLLTEYGRTDTFELAVRYQFFHALAMLLGGLLYRQSPSVQIKRANLLWLLGVFLFSGSLYFLALTNSTSMVMITPVGGVLMIAGWVFLVTAIIKK